MVKCDVAIVYCIWSLGKFICNSMNQLYSSSGVHFSSNVLCFSNACVFVCIDILFLRSVVENLRYKEQHFVFNSPM